MLGPKELLCVFMTFAAVPAALADDILTKIVICPDKTLRVHASGNSCMLGVDRVSASGELEAIRKYGGLPPLIQDASRASYVDTDGVTKEVPLPPICKSPSEYCPGYGPQ